MLGGIERLTPMRTFLKYAVALLATYMVAWTLSYLFVMVSRGDGLDLSYYLEYFVLAWTFNAFEIPTFIWLFSIIAFLPLATLVVTRMRRHDRDQT